MGRKQKNLQCTKKLCGSLVRKAKKDHFDNLDLRNVTDNKEFWKTVKPLFADKRMIIMIK